jgi:hypothetical protein
VFMTVCVARGSATGLRRAGHKLKKHVRRNGGSDARRAGLTSLGRMYGQGDTICAACGSATRIQSTA